MTEVTIATDAPENQRDYSERLRNPRFEAFCNERVCGHTPLEAYLLAGIWRHGAPVPLSELADTIAKLDRTKRHHLNISAWTLDRKEQIRGRKRYLCSIAEELSGVYLAWVLAGQKSVAQANMLDYVTVGSDGLPHVDMSKITREQAAAISEITVEQYEKPADDDKEKTVAVKKVRFKLHDKVAALRDLKRHLASDAAQRVEPVGKTFDLLGKLLSEIDGTSRGLPRPQIPHGGSGMETG